MASFIPDGFVRDGYIAAAVEESSGERLYDAMEFTYRAATRLECVRVDAQTKIARQREDIDPEAAVKAEKIVCEFVASKVVSWNLKNVGIHEVPVTATSCEHIHPFLFSSLYRIIRGVQASDKRPEEKVTPPTDEEQQKN